MIQVTENEISPPGVLAGMKVSGSGSVVLHVGVVRPFSEGKRVTSIEYLVERKEGEKELSDIASGIKGQWEIEDIALFRRAGRLSFGEVILLVAVSAPRHKAAFQACQWAVEKMKGMASVRKREVFEESRASSISPLPA
jgi:molybdopterin synthase catalytic subunit